MLVWDIPNWATLVIELSLGIPIAITLFVLDRRRGLADKKILKKIEDYNEEQQKIYRSIKLNSLGKITTFFDMLISHMEGDKREIWNIETEKLKFEHINKLLFGDSWYRHIVRYIEQDLYFVRPFITAELFEEIRSTNAGIKLLCGLHDHIFFERSRITDWINTCERMIPEIQHLRKKILELLMKENPELVPSEEKPST